MAEKDYREVVSAFCFVALIVAVIFMSGFAYGRSSVKLVEKRVEIEQVYQSGQVPRSVPVWVVYNDQGALTAYSAIKIDDGTIYPFSITGSPVPYQPLPEPEAWTTLTAGILEVLK